MGSTENRIARIYQHLQLSRKTKNQTLLKRERYARS